jgi:hypothetical protein
LDHRHRKTDIRPQRRDDKLPSPGILHRLDDALVFPGIDEGPVDRLLTRKDVLDASEKVATRSSVTVVNIVGTLNAFAALARPLRC